MHDERRRVLGLVVFSVAISITMSLMATAIIGFVSRRRAAAPADALPPDVGEPLAEVAAALEGAAGVPVMSSEMAMTEDVPAHAVGP